MMERSESTRLPAPQDDSQGRTWLPSEPLTLADLLLLLREDTAVRTLVRDIVAAHPASTGGGRGANGVPYSGTTANDGAGVPVSPDAVPNFSRCDILREQLGPELLLLQRVRADPDIAAEWLGEQTDEGRQLLQLIACAAQWDVLCDLWDKLANRCKAAQRAASPDELYILQTSLALHNLRWRGRQALLAEVAPGTAYDYERHQRGTTTGERVRAQWLPGLINAGGQAQKKPLVQT